MAAAQYRWNQYEFTRSLYVVDRGQALHFRQLFKALALAGHGWASRCEHVPFGLVRFGGKKTSTRGGNVVLLKEVFAEAAAEVRPRIAAKQTELDEPGARRHRPRGRHRRGGVRQPGDPARQGRRLRLGQGDVARGRLRPVSHVQPRPLRGSLLRRAAAAPASPRSTRPRSTQGRSRPTPSGRWRAACSTSATWWSARRRQLRAAPDRALPARPRRRLLALVHGRRRRPGPARVVRRRPDPAARLALTARCRRPWPAAWPCSASTPRPRCSYFS
jgi:hypothetical protein